MCLNQASDATVRVQLSQCAHGTFHLTVNHTTLHLTSTELTLVGQAIGRWAQCHPEWVEQFLRSATSTNSD